MMHRIRPGLITGLLMMFFFVFALWLRISLPFDSIFTSAGIKFSTVDAYYYMHIVDNLAHNFPNLTAFLPYMTYPGGGETGVVLLFAWLLAAIIWIVSLGEPTARIIDVVSVYYPVVLGALTIIPVYFIGRALLGRWAGVIAAGLIAILPGEFLGRSILGSTDHHVAESLFTTVAMLFLLLALKMAKQRRLTFGHFKRLDWTVIGKPVVFSLLAGFFFSLYMLTWLGGLLFVFIILLYFVIQFFVDHLRRESTDYLSLISLVFFSVVAIMFLPMVNDRLSLAALVIAWLVPPVLSGISRLMVKRQFKPTNFLLAVVGLGLMGLGGLYLIDSSLFRSMVETFAIFRPTGASLTTMEMQPILAPRGDFTLSFVWGNFTGSFFFALISLLLFIFLVIKRGEPDKILLLVWSLVILAATLGQRRFAYYFAVNAAVLTGYLSAWVLEQCSLAKSTSKNENNLFVMTMGGIAILFLLPVLFLGFLNPFTWLGMPALIAFFVALFFGQGDRITEVARSRSVAPRKPRFRANRISSNHVNLILALLLIFMAVFSPNILPWAGSPTRTTAEGASFVPPDAWVESLVWLEKNSPEPFGNPDYYYQTAAMTPDPVSAYGVLSWWDYGYWITRIAHRIPNVNPSQNPIVQKKVATIFTSQDEALANEITRELGSAYVVIDDQTALGKFWAVATWADKSPAEFSEIYYYHLPEENQLVPILLYYPEYYRSLAIRLYNFNGEAVTLESFVTYDHDAELHEQIRSVTPDATMVISYEDRVSGEGITIKLITGVEYFGSYQEAEAYRIAKESDKYRIVGLDPFVSPVPLEAVQGYKLVFSSLLSSQAPNSVVSVPQVKIFEFVQREVD